MRTQRKSPECVPGPPGGLARRPLPFISYGSQGAGRVVPLDAEVAAKYPGRGARERSYARERPECHRSSDEGRGG
jgi:hypothetical protein